jgi:hypothetical protein
MTRCIAVTFTDHCFTRDPEPGDDPLLIFIVSELLSNYWVILLRSLQPIAWYPETHCPFYRWQSLEREWRELCNHFAGGPERKICEVWCFLQLGLSERTPVDLHMRIRTAFPTNTNIATFGAVRFGIWWLCE